MATIKIERLRPRGGIAETPFQTPRGFKLADPRHGGAKHHAQHATYASTIEEAADLIASGFSIWMIRPGKRESLISPGSLRVTRA